MKKFILLSILFFNAIALTEDSTIENSEKDKINEDDYSLILLLTDEQNNNYIANSSLNKLKKCSFPTGPIRNNEIPCSKFEAISTEIIDKINSSIEDKEYLALPFFCIDSAANGINCKTYSFSVPNHEDLCYVFNFEQSFKEAKAAILSNEQLNDLMIDVSTNNESVDTDIAPKPEKHKSKIVTKLQAMAVTVILNALELYDNIKTKYSNVVQRLRNIKIH